MSRHIPSHRVEIVDDDVDSPADRSHFRDKSPPRAYGSHSDREGDRDRNRERDWDRSRPYHDRGYTDYDHHQDHFHRGYPPYMHFSHMYHPYYGPPVVYQPPNGHGPQQYGHPYTQQWSPPPQDSAHSQNNPQNGVSPQMAQRGFQAPPQMHPQFLAVNVKTDTHQTQSQDQSQEATNKQVTVKEKVIHNVSKGMESMLDVKVLAAGLGALVIQHFIRQTRENVKKRKKRGLALTLGLV